MTAILMKLKKPFITIILTIGVLGAGIYMGVSYAERESIKNELHDSTLQIVFNLETIRHIREGEVSTAIDLINADNEQRLVYLMHYDVIKTGDSKFMQRKKKVLSALSKEWDEHQYFKAGKDVSYMTKTEWRRYKADIQRYLNQHAITLQAPQKQYEPN